MIKFPLTNTEIKDVAEKLKKLKPGFLPFDLFYQFNRLKVTITIEVVPLCLGPNGEVMVVLFNRGPDDAWWPNLYHTPGTCLVNGDITKKDEWGLPTRTFKRLKKAEFKGINLISSPVFIGNLSHQTNRGPESVHVYIQKVDYKSAKPYLFPVKNLPKNMMDHQISMIKKCASFFKSNYA
jgi:hypothetical protein